MYCQNTEATQREIRELIIRAISKLILRKDANIPDLFISSPNKMLWEAIKVNDSVIMRWEDIPRFLLDVNCLIYILPEPLTDLYYGNAIRYLAMESRAASEYFIEERLIEVEGMKIIMSNWAYGNVPLYLFDVNLSWMISLTAENQADGTQLCVLTRHSTDLLL